MPVAPNNDCGYNDLAMKQDFSDRASFLKAAHALKDATFYGRDLVYDEESRTMTLTVTRVDPSTSGMGGGGFFGARKPAYLKSVVTVRHIATYRQSLTDGDDDVYVVDRAEVGRGGEELAFYFRPGDRAVMDVERIDGVIVDAGKATSMPRKPVVMNPLLKKERETGRSGKGGRKR